MMAFRPRPDRPDVIVRTWPGPGTGDLRHETSDGRRWASVSRWEPRATGDERAVREGAVIRPRSEDRP